LKLWVDACLTPRLEGVAHRRGYEATSNRARGMLTWLDPNLYPVVVAEDWVFVTNNEKDFRDLAAAARLHPGLIVLPQGTVVQQRAWFDTTLGYVEAHAADESEPPGDWMICRIVTYDDRDHVNRHGWLPGAVA
jgi:predicted nuclease of predicted toxin-antitoxin system